MNEHTTHPCVPVLPNRLSTPSQPTHGQTNRSLPAYHRMGHDHPNRTWWRPLTTLLVVLVSYLLLALVAGLVLGVATLTLPDVAGFFSVVVSDGYDFDDLTDPATLLIGLGCLALAIPAVRWGTRLGGGRPSGGVDSVVGRFRWRLFASFLRPAAVAVLPILALLLVLDPAAAHWTSASAWILVLALVLVPLQAAGEEYLFRGLIMQVIGTWLRSPLWGLAISLPLFTFGHIYDAKGLVSVAVFAAVATWVTWRTGGLEAAVALHAMNNSAIFALGALGMADLNATSAGWPQTVLSGVIPLIFAGLVQRWWSRQEQ